MFRRTERRYAAMLLSLVLSCQALRVLSCKTTTGFREMRIKIGEQPVQKAAVRHVGLRTWINCKLQIPSHYSPPVPSLAAPAAALLHSAPPSQLDASALPR